MNISNNISSIQSHQTLLNSSAHNVANVNTDRYVPNDTLIVENGKSTSTHTRKADDNGSEISQTDLAVEIPDQIVAQDGAAVNVAAVKTQDEMFGTLLDIKA